MYHLECRLQAGEGVSPLATCLPEAPALAEQWLWKLTLGPWVLPEQPGEKRPPGCSSWITELLQTCSAPF